MTDKHTNRIQRNEVVPTGKSMTGRAEHMADEGGAGRSSSQLQETICRPWPALDLQEHESVHEVENAGIKELLHNFHLLQ